MDLNMNLINEKKFIKITIELNKFNFICNNQILSLKDLKTLNNKTINIKDLISPYKFKSNPILNNIKGYLFNIHIKKGYGTDLYFISFIIFKPHIKQLHKLFYTNHKYINVFSKKERSLLYLLKNKDYKDIHKDLKYSNGELEYKNPKQFFKSENEFKYQRYLNNKHNREIQRLWIKLNCIDYNKYNQYLNKFKEDLKEPKKEQKKFKRTLQGLFYYNPDGSFNSIAFKGKIPLKVTPQENVFWSTEKIEKKEKKVLW